MPRAGRRSPSPRSPRASKARPPSAGSRKRRVGKPANAPAATVPVTARQALWLELMPFYIHEAWLLDERRFKEWLDLFTDDVLYFMPKTSAASCRSSATVVLRRWFKSWARNHRNRRRPRCVQVAAETACLFLVVASQKDELLA